MKKALFAALFAAFACVFTGAAALDDAITKAVKEIGGKLPKGARIAVTNFHSEAAGISDYIMEELTYAFTETGLEVADRANLPYVRQELNVLPEGRLGQGNRGRYRGIAAGPQ